MLNYEFLERKLAKLRGYFLQAKPFPHVFLDGIVDHATLRAAMLSWPVTSPGWKTFQQGKRGFQVSAMLPDVLRDVIDELNGPRFVVWLRRLSGIEMLQSDFTLSGGGLHEVARGGRLGMHVDFNRLGTLYRRLNVLLYLNEGWQSEWGGDLLLRDHPSDWKDQVSIEPRFNRLVIFESTDTSWHGHPTPLECPEGQSRKSIATYYYTAEPPANYVEKHSTIYDRKAA